MTAGFARDVQNGESLEYFRSILETNLKEFLSEVPDSEPIASAISYVLNSGGKKIRPLFTLSLFADLGEDVENFGALALSTELLHIASLVHDDLPALDNDELRRGQKTCHVKFNEATAILTGDILV